MQPEQQPQQTEEKVPELPEFHVKNYSRARRIAQHLYGPLVRLRNDGGDFTLWMQKGDEKTSMGFADSWTNLLRLGVYNYIIGGLNYEDTKKRIRVMAADAEVTKFALEALQQFPEYKAEVEAAKKKKTLLGRIEQMLANTKTVEPVSPDRFQVVGPPPVNTVGLAVPA